MSTFLKDIVRQLHSQNPSFKDLVFVLPSKRAGVFLKREIANSLEKPIFSPDIYSIEELIQIISQYQQTTNLELLLLLYETAKPYLEPERADFESFIGWGNTLLADFNEIDRNLIEAQSIFDYLTATKRLNAWGAQNTDAPLLTQSVQFWTKLYPIYTAFQEFLASQKKGYQGLLYKKAVAQILPYLETHKAKHFHFIGFNALNTAEEAIIEQFTQNVATTLWWDLDPYFLNDPIHETGIFIRQYLKKWPKNIGALKTERPFLTDKVINISGVPKSISQAQLSGTLLEDLAAKSSKESIALVLAEEGLLNPILSVLPTTTTKVNITMGLPLTQTHGNTFFETLLQLCHNQNENGWYHRDVQQLLSHPYSKTLLEQPAENLAVTLGKHIKSNNLLFISPPFFTEDPWRGNTILAQLFPSKNWTAKAFITNCLALLQQLRAKYKDQGDHRELQVLYGFFKIFNQLETQLVSRPYLQNIKAIWPLFRELLSLERIDFKGEPLGGIQIMGVLESRNLDFDHVIITSVNEGILPSGKSSNSFIPFDIKREFKMPTYKEKGAIYAYHFYRLLQRAKTVHILYNTEPDVLLGNEKSRFIAQLLADPVIAQHITHTTAAPALIKSTKPTPGVNKTDGLVQALQNMAQKGFSPSSLANYIRDPFGFYLNNVLKLNELEKVEEQIAHNTFGTIVHDTLENLYKPLIGQQLTKENLSALNQNIKAHTLKQFKVHYAEKDLKTGQNLIALSVVQQYIKTLIDLDSQRAERHSIKLLALEQDLKVPLDLPGCHFKAYLRGKLDRMELVDGQTNIIDYKTGQVKAVDLKIKSLPAIFTEEKYSKGFQLLCYALMQYKTAGVKTLKAGIVPIKNLKSGILQLSLAETKSSLIDEKTLLDFEANLKSLYQEILNPNIPLNPKD